MEMSRAGSEARGAIFTKREVVDFIFDLTGYSPAKPLHKMRLLEPSFGDGAFLLPAIERLLVAWQRAGEPEPISSLANAVRAVELHAETFLQVKDAIVTHLLGAGITARAANELAQIWLIHADFLLAPSDGMFDFVVGNPPYVRQELIPDKLMAEYRARYRTIYDRADIYIPFIERSLTSLNKRGQLGFICADRWMKNRYGGPLREMVAKDFHLKFYIDMVDTPAFDTDVIAYPAITIISREGAGVTKISRRPKIKRDALTHLAGLLLNGEKHESVQQLPFVTSGRQPWVLDSSVDLDLVRRLEQTFPSIEEAGCKVGIGVATGADKAFIGRYDEMDVEADRKLRLVMTRDIADGTVNWRGSGVINPFADSGRLVDLDEYPRLRGFLNARRREIAGRHVAQKSPANWYRTIDRIYPDLATRPKLLIPDIKGDAHIVFEEGKLYPHHNLYFITANDWDLQALQAVLLSGIARLFVAAYSTKMRGGFLRFQAQYLRRIRIPRWVDVPAHLREALITGAKCGDLSACNDAVFELYGLSDSEQAVFTRKCT